MASELITIPKERIRPIERKSVGGAISFLAQADKDRILNPKLIIEILADFGVGPQGERVHKIRLTERGEVYVDDAGLALLTA